MARRLPSELEVRERGNLTMQPLDTILKRLAQVDARPNAVVSLYLDARWNDEQQRERARLTLKRAVADAIQGLHSFPREVAESLERDLARAEEHAMSVIKQRRDVGFEGIAAFYCEAKGLDMIVLSHATMPTKLHVGPRPEIWPLARFANDFEIALVAVVETDETRIFEVALSGVLAEESVEADVPDRVQRGGWRQLRIQKHIADHILHHHQQAARELCARFDGISAGRGRAPRVVLGGREPMLASLERTLPERVLMRAIRSPKIDPKGSTSEVLEQVREILALAVRRTQSELIHLAKEAAAVGRGALGVAPVIQAANAGRLWQLVVDERFQKEGSRCTRCDLLFSQSFAESCPACAGSVEAVSLRDELTRRAVLVGADVYAVDDSGELANCEGVAATLKY
ncbi:MAG: hypothetical protein HY698_15570 [Deltaproteobacteria bacterium]|nr:hypothetical protein [Deltaproteobacteria bacterium]